MSLLEFLRMTAIGNISGYSTPSDTERVPSCTDTFLSYGTLTSPLSIVNELLQK